MIEECYYMKISRAAQAVEPSLSRKLFNMAQNYGDVIDLTLGDPDLMPSQTIRDAACQAIQRGYTRYSANAGLKQLREAVADNIQKEYGLLVDPISQVAITVGGMEALYLSLACLVDDGDEVLILAPYYVNYKQMVGMCGGKPVILNTTEADGFAISVKKLEEAVTDKTVAIMVNSPSNPTGAVLSRETLEGIADIAKRHDLVVISDEVYRTLTFDGKKHESIATFPGMAERTVIIDSLSKRFAMTGYRLGYAVAPAKLIENMVKMQENVAACAPLPAQHAAIEAFKSCTGDTAIVEEFQARRDYIYNAINAIDGLSCRKPEATFYLFVNIEKTGLDCQSFAYQLLEAEHVAVVPGITYGDAYSGYIRIAYTMKIETLEKAVERIRRFMQGLMEK